MSIRNALTQSIWLLVSRGSGALMQALALAVLARRASPSELGIVIALMGVMAFASGLAGLGLGPYALRSYARQGSLSENVLRLNAASTVVAAALGALSILAVAAFGDLTPDAALFLAPLVLWVGAEKNTDIWTNLAVARGRTRAVAVGHFANRTVLLGCVGFASVGEHGAILGYTSGAALGAVAGNFLIRLAVRRHLNMAHDARPYRTIIATSFPFMVNTVGAQIKNLDIATVTALAGPAVAGLYGLPARIAAPLSLLPSAVSPILMRYTALGTREGNRVALSMFTGTLSISAVALGGILLTAEHWMGLLFGAEYVGAVAPLRVLCVGLVFSFASTMLTSMLQGTGRERVVGYVAVGVNVLAVTLVALGAVTWSAVGAALGLSSAYAIQTAALVVVAIRNGRSMSRNQNHP